MPGIIPPPTPPGKLGFDAKTLVTLTKSGALIEIGQGLFGRIDKTTGQLALDAITFDPPEQFSIFNPGAVTAAKTLGVWANTRASGKAVGLSLEANYLTAPTTADGANYFGLKASDALGNAMTLPLSGVSKHFSLNDARGVVIAQPFSKASGNWQDSSNLNPCAYFSAIVPTQALTVTGLQASFMMFATLSSTWIQGNYAARILDVNGNELASSKQFVSALSTGTAPQQSFPFPLSVQLAAGTTYYVAFDCFDFIGNDTTSTWELHRSTIPVATSTTNSAPITHGAVALGSGVVNHYGPSYNTGPSALPSGVTWDQIIPVTAPYHSKISATTTAHNDPVFDSSNAGFNVPTALLGSGAGAAFVGDVTLSLVTVGAPLASSGGSDLNARVLLGV